MRRVGRGVVESTAAFGIVGCSSSTDGSVQQTCTSMPSSIMLYRGIDGIAIADSQASATFVHGDVTTQESLYWPSIPADVVRDALALHDRLTDAARLAAYKALLPPEAQGDGHVVIHHSSEFDDTFRAAAVYEVEINLPPSPAGSIQLGGGVRQSDFDAQGAPADGWTSGPL